MNETTIAGIYRHYKGGFYLLLGLAEQTESGEFLAVYVSLDATRPGLRMRARPLEGPGGWNTLVDMPDGTKQIRFMYEGLEVPKQ